MEIIVGGNHVTPTAVPCEGEYSADCGMENICGCLNVCGCYYFCVVENVCGYKDTCLFKNG